MKLFKYTYIDFYTMVFFSDPNLWIDEQCSLSSVIVSQLFVKKLFFMKLPAL